MRVSGFAAPSLSQTRAAIKTQSFCYIQPHTPHHHLTTARLTYSSHEIQHNSQYVPIHARATNSIDPEVQPLPVAPIYSQLPSCRLLYFIFFFTLLGEGDFQNVYNPHVYIRNYHHPLSRPKPKVDYQPEYYTTSI